MTVIDRPEVDFDAIAHAYRLEGEDVLGVSTIAKMGGADEAWGIASAWGFRVGHEGAHLLASEHGALSPFTVTIMGKNGPERIEVNDSDSLRQAMIGRGLSPWAKKDKAAERGSWVHDMLEELGQDGAVPNMRAFAERHGEEAAGHARSVLAWFLWLRPKFVALEVQVASRRHSFAGRYDVRLLADARKVLMCIDPDRTDPQAERVRELARRGEMALGLVDLKTSKGVYPTSHFAQLEGYEGGGGEMGYPATDFRAVLNTNADGTFDPAPFRLNEYGDEKLGDFAVSWATYDDFVAYAGALRAIRRIQDANPSVIRERRLEAALVAALPARSRELVGMPEAPGLDARAIGARLGKLAKRGKCVKGERGLWLPPA
jgi:hypothetical protein